MNSMGLGEKWDLLPPDKQDHALALSQVIMRLISNEETYGYGAYLAAHVYDQEQIDHLIESMDECLTHGGLNEDCEWTPGGMEKITSLCEENGMCFSTWMRPKGALH